MSHRMENILVVTIAQETKASRSSPRGWGEASTVELRFRKVGNGLEFTCGGKKFRIELDEVEAIYDLHNGATE